MIAGTHARAQSTLVVALNSFVEDSLDPSLVGGSTAPILLPQIFDYLTMLSPNNRIVPGLASSWKVSDDGKQWTFTLRKDVKFHNGDPVTAEDVVYSFERQRGPKAFRSRWGFFIKGNITTIEAPDPHTVVVNMKEPAPDMLRIVGPTYGGVEIVPKKYLQSVGDDGFVKKPVGSGPYRLVSHEPGVKIVYEAQKSHPFRPKPGFDRLVLLNIPEESTRIALLQRGEAQLTSVSPDRASDIRGDLELRVVSGAYQVGIAYWMPWVNKDAALANTKVRQALAHAVDANAIIKGMYSGRGSPSLGWGVFQASEFADPKRPSMQPLKYDPELARRLLKEAGAANPEVKLYSISGDGIAPELPKLATVVADYWSKVGAKVEIVSQEMGEFRAGYRAAAKGKDTDAASKRIGNIASTFRLPAILDIGFLCANAQGYWRSNGTSPFVNDPRVDKLCTEAMVGATEQDRNAKLHEVYDILRTNLGGGFAITDTPALWAVNKKTVGAWKPIEAYGIGLGVIFETIQPAKKG